MIDNNGIAHIGKPEYGDVEKRVLTLMPHDLNLPNSIGNYSGVYLDVETTGKYITEDKSKDEVTSLAYIKFTFDDDYNICSIKNGVVHYNEPSFQIPEDIQHMTGLTNEFLKGKKIEKKHLEDMLSDNPEIIIAHNAFYDRYYIDRLLNDNGIDTNMVWGCTDRDLNLRHTYKIPSGSLPIVIAYLFDWYFPHHSALDDCFAGLHLLKGNFEKLMLKAFEETYSVYALNAPFKDKDILKDRKYKWNDSDKVWILPNVSHEIMESEVSFLKELGIKDAVGVLNDNRRRYANGS